MKKVFTLFLLLLCVATGWAGVDPTPTTDIESGTYIIKAFSDKNENGGYVFLNNSNATADANTNTKNFEGQVTPLIDTYKTYLWTVTKNTDGSITITSYSDATKSFPANPSNTQAFTLGNTAGSYTLQSASNSYPNCFYLKIGSHFVHSNGTKGNNNNLGFWDGSGNSAVKACFYKATIDESVSVTYKYTHNGKTIKTVTGQWGVGFAYPNLLEIPDYVTSTLPEGTVPNEDVTKEIPVTWDDMPFKENQWYFIKLGCVGNASDGYLYDKNDNATRIDMGVTTKDLSTTNYLWKFEGDPLNGYTLTSANGHKLVTPTVSGNGGTTFAYAASNAPTNGFDTWVAYKPTSTDITNNNGFFLAVKDHATWKLNSRDVPNTTKKALSFWTDGADKGSAIFVDATLPDITLNTLNNKNYATYYLPFAAKAPEGVTAYAGTINNGNVQLTEYANGVIPANKGVVLVSDTKTTATFTLADASDVREQANDLTGMLTETELNSVNNSDQVRIFSKKDNVAGFYRPNSSITTLAANKAYIMAPTNEGALVLNFAGGEVTGINQATINATEANAPIYDLTGRRVAKAVKGIYVKNGKKFIVK